MTIFLCIVIGFQVGLFIAICVWAHETIRLNTESQQLLEEADKLKAEALAINTATVMAIRRASAWAN